MADLSGRAALGSCFAQHGVCAAVIPSRWVLGACSFQRKLLILATGNDSECQTPPPFHLQLQILQDKLHVLKARFLSRYRQGWGKDWVFKVVHYS